MADHAVRAAGVTPGLRATAPASGGDGDGLARAGREQVRFRAIGPPLISHAVWLPRGTDHKEPCFQPTGDRWIRIIDGQFKMLDEHRARRKTPFRIRRELDALRRSGANAVVRKRQPAVFDCTIGPQRCIDVIGNHPGCRGECDEVGKRAGLREQRRRVGNRRASLGQLVEEIRISIDLDEIDFAIRVDPAARRAGIYRAAGHVREILNDRRIRAVWRQRPDASAGVIDGDEFPQQRGLREAVVKVAADDTAAAIRIAVAVVPERLGERALEHRGRGLWSRDGSLSKGPAIVATFDEEIDFLACAIPYVSHPDLPGAGVVVEAIGIAKPDRIKLLQLAARRIDEGIVVRDEIARRKTVRPARRKWELGGLPPAGVAMHCVLVHVDPQDAGKKPLVSLLSVIELVGRTAFVADADIQKPIRPEEKAPAVMPRMTVVLLDHHHLGSGIGHRLSVRDCETRKPPVSLGAVASVWQWRPLIGDIEEAAVRRASLAKVRVKREVSHPAIAAREYLRAEVEEQRLLRGIRIVVELPNLSRLFHHEQVIRARIRGEIERLRETQSRESRRHRPSAARAGSLRRKHAIEKRPHRLRPVQALRGDIGVQRMCHHEDGCED